MLYILGEGKGGHGDEKARMEWAPKINKMNTEKNTLHKSKDKAYFLLRILQFVTFFRETQRPLMWKPSATLPKVLSLPTPETNIELNTGSLDQKV